MMKKVVIWLKCVMCRHVWQKAGNRKWCPSCGCRFYPKQYKHYPYQR